LSESSLKSRWRFWAGWTVESKLAIVRLTLILTVTLLIVAVGAFVSGCGSRTIFVPEESPMRVGPRAEMRVYHRINGEWTLSNNRISVPEGWYLVPPSYVKE
jgi:hypothetical protein